MTLRIGPRGAPDAAWVMNQARSRAIDRLRFEQRQKRVNPYPGDPPLENALSDVSELPDTEEQRGLLQDALSALTKGEREAIETAFFGELTPRGSRHAPP
jgi:RNA polymerase sigma-70 factor, ECF subfamily